MPFRLRRVLVHGPSMVPTLRHGDQLLVWWAPRARVGDVVVADLPDRGPAVKRVVRADGERVWLEGDNPFGSTDSRTLGELPRSVLRGRVLLRIWPRPGVVRRR